MNNEIFPKNNIENIESIEAILSNCSFKRFAGGFELYQNLINSKQEQRERNLIINKMRALYKSRIEKINNSNESNKSMGLALAKLLTSTMDECESGNFNKESFAEKIATSSLHDLFLAEWNHKAGDKEENSGMYYVNELIAYRFENGETISLHLRPSNVEGKDITKKMLEGFKEIAKKIKSGEIKTHNIILKSWLYGREFESKTKQLLGNEVRVEDVPPDDKQIEAIQFLCLQYNNKLLKKYLETGEKPEVRQIVMTSSEFLQRFGE